MLLGKKEAKNYYRLALFGNTWLAPFLIKKGDTQAALDALSLIGKALYTNGPGEPFGLDGIVPLAVWYEGTLSYIAAGGPGSRQLFENILPFINSDGTVPHYNDNIGSMAGIWAVDWADGMPSFLPFGKDYHCSYRKQLHPKPIASSF